MLHQFIPNYLDQNDPELQIDLSKRKEFFDLESERKEVIGSNGFFNHQNLIFRFMLIYDRLFLFHETGTGKSGTFVNISEYFKKHPEYGIRQAVALEPGPATIENLKDQILKHASPGEYENEITENTTNVMTLKRIKTNMLKDWYLIEGYESFSRKVRKLSDEEIRLQFSDTFFFLDEIHSIRNLTDTVSDEKENKFESLWRVLHLAERIKIIIATATPMVNKTEDFVGIMNLLLPSDNQLAFSFDYTKVTMQQLMPYLNGKISFLRGSDTGINVIREGSIINHIHHFDVPKNEYSGETILPVKKKIINGKIISSPEPFQGKIKMKERELKSQFIITPLLMKETQKKGYLKAVRDGKKKGENDEKKDSFLLQESYASLWVFPELKGRVEYGEKGFKENFEKDDEGEWIMKDHFAKYFTTEEKGLKTIEDCGCKINFFIRNELKQKGKSFCYLELVKNTGTELLGLLLEQFSIKGKKFENFQKFGSSRNVFKKEKGAQKKTIVSSFKKHPRFAIFTSETQNTDYMLELFNSEENIDGEYLKIIIVSKTASTGINLTDVLRGYIMSPGWHESGMHQAESRFLRSTSHIGLLKKYGKADVRLYNLAAIYKKADIDNSSDVRKYMLAEKKDMLNKRLVNIMKQLSFDAFINYRRNFLLTDVNETKNVDYLNALPTLPNAEDDPNKESKKLAYGQLVNYEIIEETNDLLYQREEVEEIKEKIKSILRNRGTMVYTELKELGKKKHTLTAIDELVIEKTRVRNVFGEDMYIGLYGDSLYLSKEFPKKDKLPVLSPFIFAANERKVLEYKESKKKIMGKIEKLVASIEEKNMNLSQLTAFINLQKLDSTVMRDLLEYAFINADQKVYQDITSLFSLYIYRIKYPKTNIQMANAELRKPKEGKVGRQAGETSVSVLKKILSKYTEPDGDYEVFVHFYPKMEAKTSYAVNSIFTRKDKPIRVYSAEEEEWRDATQAENHVYNWIIDKEFEKRIEKYTKNEVYGSRIYRDNKFRINLVKEGKKIECGSMNHEDIISVLSLLPLDAKLKDIDREKLEKELKKENIFFNENYSTERLQKLLYWKKKGMNKRAMCNQAEEIMRKHDMLLNTL